MTTISSSVTVSGTPGTLAGRSAPGGARPLSFADAPESPLLHDASRRSGRRRDGVAPAAAPGRLRPPTGVRDLLAAAARVPRRQARRADHPRGAGPDWRPGDGDAGRPSRRGLEG